VRAHYLREREDLENAGATSAVFEEAEVAVALARLVMTDAGAKRDVVEQKVRNLRLQIIAENMSKILEHAVGRDDDELPPHQKTSLSEALADGGVVLNLSGRTPEEAIHELADAIPAGRVPTNANIADLAMAREREVSTDLGVGVAVPHARFPGLSRPFVVFGRSTQGIRFSSESPEPVQSVFLLVTPLERPELQLSFLAQLARVAGDDETRERLLKATSAAEVVDIVRQLQAQ
jgi:mannitol/fructose-specific phosphotransferase system IIA component (Ntr-type)